METHGTLPINAWREEDRPREKLLLKGKAALTNAELLAILIGSGTTRFSALAISRAVLSSVDHNLEGLMRMSTADLCGFQGIGQAKAVKIAAAMELGRRRNHQVVRPPRTISSSKEVFDLMRSRLGDLGHEEFWCIYLNNANRVLSERQLSKGGITGTMVDVRLVYQAALQMGSVAVILVHNHPSGTLRPSEADKRLTAKLQQGGSQLDIQVLDHVIITEKAYFSFADEHLL